MRSGNCISAGAILLALAACLIPEGCGRQESAPSRKKIVIGLLARSRTDPLSLAVLAGARSAAADLGRRYGVEVAIDCQSPAEEDAGKQALALEQLARSGASGIAVSCIDADVLAPAIDKAVELGSMVMCFDSDAPRSRRLCFLCTDDAAAGALLIQELSREMGGKGTVAIISGKPGDPRLEKRIEGALEEIRKHPDLKLLDEKAIHRPQASEKAARLLATLLAKDPGIGGWALLDPWPLGPGSALPWKPGEAKAVSMDALPEQIPFLESGHVQALYLQNGFRWGSRCVEILLRKILRNEGPEGDRIAEPLEKIAKENARECLRNWNLWLGKEPEPPPAEKK